MSGNEAFDPYKTLQVDPEAEDEVLEAAYRRLARKYHPDVAPGDDAQTRMVALNRAWEMLRDPAKRAAVDRIRAAAATRHSAGEHRHGTPGTPAGGVPDRRSAGDPGTGPPPSPGAAAGAGGPAESGGFGSDTRRGLDPSAPGYSPGRSFTGSGYDPGTMRSAEGLGAAGRPPGNPTGPTLGFGRYAGWSLGEIARVDLEYLEWLDRMPIGRPYQGEIDRLLRVAGRRADAASGGTKRGLFRRT